MGSEPAKKNVRDDSALKIYPDDAPKDMPSLLAWFRGKYPAEEMEKDFEKLDFSGPTMDEVIADIRKSMDLD